MMKHQNKVSVGHKDVTETLVNLLDKFIHLMEVNHVKREDAVALSVRNPLLFYAAYKGCKELGIIPIVMGEMKDPQKELARIRVPLFCYELDLDFCLERYEDIEQAPIPEDAGAIVRTTGSVTGMPKFVVWSNKGIEYQSEQTVKRLGFTVKDVLFAAVPLWGAYGISLVNIIEKCGMDLVIPEHLRPRYVLRLIKESGATLFEGTPSFYKIMLEHFSKNAGERNTVSNMRSWGCGGEILPETVARKWFEIVKQPILDGYGLSEAGPNVALNTCDDYCIGTVGKPLKGIELRLNDKRELLVRSPSNMIGYYSSNSVENPIDAQGWLNTGDLAEINENGFLKIIGRTKNIIVIKEKNISPEYIEQKLRHYQDIQDVAVVGVRNENNGMRLAAIFISKNHQNINLKHVKRYAQEHLEKDQVPFYYKQVDEFPMLANGKIDRVALGKLCFTQKAKVVNRS
ncbi:fatty acid--CoA ligase family protein [Bacillus sp. CLL-7-23]|uniref:Fatty acid--CoA ligase family protein n=1 Tax=Bacillus changyiensis TaxID=3004103 RepID=A0ABT4X4C2_9BACI|nr:fatty acid--CoA ligase family protein [Bacillus changyiensis]MDA7026594.1 fatty acid--CoA ligase family protein [Bacillus changyiensis]